LKIIPKDFLVCNPFKHKSYKHLLIYPDFGSEQMDVKLIGMMPQPEMIPAMAAKLTHSKTVPSELGESSEKELKGILKHVMELGHTSVIEHTCFTFVVSGVSRSLTHQLVRHRIASYAQQSQRYVNLVEPEFVTPPSIKNDTEMRKIYQKTMQFIWMEYNRFLEHGIPAEDARYMLPNATFSNIMVTMNARSLLNFFELRCCLHAQWEIRTLANKMLNLVKNKAPTLFSKAGPACKTKGYCPENKPDCPWYPK
jgi:thymidylate synthase (FAD)